MFSSLKTKLLNVQEVCSNSLRNLKLDRQSRVDERKKLDQNHGIVGDAGTELLCKYQNVWAEIHKKTENAALCAQEVDEIIITLSKSIENQWVKVEEIGNSIARVPKLVHVVQEISDHILNLQCQFDETENALLMLEDLIETSELREKQLDQRFQLALYQERRMAELDDLKMKLTDNHLKKVDELEKKKARELKERQKVFQNAFEDDLLQFKTQGTLPKMEPSVSSTPSPSLEEIELEDDPVVLESFLLEEMDNDGTDKEVQDQPTDPLNIYEKMTL